MPSQRRAPGKRPPRPAAKKPPSPAGATTGAGTTTDATTSTATAAPAMASSTPTPTGATNDTATKRGGDVGASAGSVGTDPAEGAKGTESATDKASRSTKTVSPTGKTASPTGRTTSPTGRTASPTGKGIASSGKDGSATIPKGGNDATQGNGTTKSNGANKATKAVTATPKGRSGENAGSERRGAKAGGTTAKSAGPGSRPKTSPSGPVYRSPTGQPRSAARRPPPKKKKPKVTKKTIGAAVALLAIASVVVFFSLAVNGNGSGNPNPLPGPTPENIPVPNGPVLAAVNSSEYGQTIDGIKCEQNEQLQYHIHVHLTIFVSGAAQEVPYGIGISPPLQTEQQNGTLVVGGACFYWLHTHAADGVIHIESPSSTIYTLGDFFDIWGQPLNKSQVGPALGKVTVFQDGTLYTGDPRAVKLSAHNQIQLDVGKVTPAQPLITNWGHL